MGKCKRAPSNILEVGFCEAPAFVKGVKKKRGAKRAGILFEEKVNAKLRKKLGKQYVKSPWIRFRGEHEKARICQPDGMYIDKENKILTIVECKYTSTKDAWYQLNTLYMPVLRAFAPDYKIRGVQVFKECVPNLEYPEKPEVISFDEIGDTGWESGNKICRLRI